MAIKWETCYYDEVTRNNLQKWHEAYALDEEGGIEFPALVSVKESQYGKAIEIESSDDFKLAKPFIKSCMGKPIKEVLGVLTIALTLNGF